MSRFKITYFYLQGGSYKSYDWLPGQPQPVERCTRTGFVEAESQEEAIKKFSNKNQIIMDIPKNPLMGTNYFEKIEIA